LPWRAPNQGARPALVEGLLAQTRAEAVADHYDRVFRGVWSAGDWACVSRREARVAPLGLPSAKVAAVDGIAACLLVHATTWRDLVTTPGVGPYTAAMVAVLHGHAAAPVDCNVERVVLRVGAGQWDAAAMIAY
jgi:adenine-specific DNA glycosylase